ncbi:PIN-like domain-containing protein [Amycolatopsis vastitatis]|uniref:PIN-like domain-containing protein n=1 Tax=Amycolatopsis vastitatis TaxID=1905142 RepID=UPI001178A810|nr:PIN domain-containing protein [Amycolatopsis vastitatis]
MTRSNKVGIAGGAEKNSALTGLLDGFDGYYRVPSDQREAVYLSGLIVFDTNALLDLYRFTPVARAEMFALLQVLSPRLFIPYQVAAEFHQRRINAVSDRRREFQDQIQSIEEFGNQTQALIKRVAQRAHGRTDQADLVLASMREIFDKGRNFIVQASDDYDLDPALLARSSSDPILDELQKVLSGRVARRPNSETLEADRKEAERRAREQLPPGFKDKAKDKNSAGDYLWWAEVIRYAKGKVSHVLIVSNDVAKGDWTYEQHGFQIGPDPRLVREMQDLAGCRLILATTTAMLGEAPKIVGASVSPETVAEAASIAEEADEHRRKSHDSTGSLLEQLPEGRSADYLETVLDMLRLADPPVAHGDYIRSFQQRFHTITRYDEACRRARVLESLGLAEGLAGSRSDMVSLTLAGRRLIDEQDLEFLQQQILKRIRGAKDMAQIASSSDSDLRGLFVSGEFPDGISATQASVQLRWLKALRMIH